jgi:superfamily II DNA/RNA helicase
MLCYLDNNPKLRRTLVFVETRRDADLLAVYLDQYKIKSSTING